MTVANECSPGCRICARSDREAIDAALAAGNSLRKVAARFEGTNKDLLAVHWRNAKSTVLASSDSATRLNALKARIEKNLVRAEKAEDFRQVTELQRQLLELEERLALAAPAGPQRTNSKPDPDWIRGVRQALGFNDLEVGRSEDMETGEKKLTDPKLEAVRVALLNANHAAPEFEIFGSGLLAWLTAEPMDARLVDLLEEFEVRWCKVKEEMRVEDMEPTQVGVESGQGASEAG